MCVKIHVHLLILLSKEACDSREQKLRGDFITHPNDAEEGIGRSLKSGLLTPGSQLPFHRALQPLQESVGTGGFCLGQRSAHVAREGLPCPASLPVLLSEGRLLCSPAEDTVPGVNIYTLMGGWG